MTTTVYMADLRHNYGGILSTDCMPLSVGYMKAVMDRDLPADEFEVQIFAYPDDLLQAMETKAPDVLMVSNYVWNEALGHFFIRRAKKLNPDSLTVMGGPNIPIETERQIENVSRHPELDIYVLGEGDFLARDLVKRFAEADKSVDALLESELPSSLYRHGGGSYVRNDQWSRNEGGNVNDIPSPWLTGVMDKFFDGKMAPIIETNRGCPFKCSFCVQGTGFYTKVTNFELDRLKDEIDYIGQRISTYSPEMGTLRIADANYGMYERDVEISSYIGVAQKKYGWPTFIDATTGKNKPERIIESMEQVNGALVLYQAVQSLDDEVLRNIRRSNIKLDTYEKIQVHVRGRGMRSTSDLILGLPGESLKSHLSALHKLIDAGTNQAHCFQSMMLKGADMETLETRDQFKFDTRYRVLPKNYGEYGSEKVFDVEEIIVATHTLPFEDYLECRSHHLTFSVFWNDSWFNDLMALADRFEIKPSQWLTAMLNAMKSDTGEMRQFLSDFLEETRNELFDSKEACVAFYADPKNFEKLERGEIGDNLMYKYRAKASFFLWKKVCRISLDATADLLKKSGIHERMDDFDGFWRDLHAWTEARHATGIDVDEILRPIRLVQNYDIQKWLDDGSPLEIDLYRLKEATTFEYRLTEDGARELQAALKVWTSQLTGLTKLVTRIRVTSQVRQCVPESELVSADL